MKTIGGATTMTTVVSMKQVLLGGKVIEWQDDQFGRCLLLWHVASCRDDCKVGLLSNGSLKDGFSPCVERSIRCRIVVGYAGGISGMKFGFPSSQGVISAVGIKMRRRAFSPGQELDLLVDVVVNGIEQVS